MKVATGKYVRWSWWVYSYVLLCTQFTKAYVAETSLLLIDWFCCVYAHQDLFASCHNIAMSLYNIMKVTVIILSSSCAVCLNTSVKDCIPPTMRGQASSVSTWQWMHLWVLGFWGHKGVAPSHCQSTSTSFEVGNANGLGQSGRLWDGIRLNSQWRCSDWGVWGLTHIQANM